MQRAGLAEVFQEFRIAGNQRLVRNEMNRAFRDAPFAVYVAAQEGVIVSQECLLIRIAQEPIVERGHLKHAVPEIGVTDQAPRWLAGADLEFGELWFGTGRGLGWKESLTPVVCRIS